jgi:hypothetical protein
MKYITPDQYAKTKQFLSKAIESRLSKKEKNKFRLSVLNKIRGNFQVVNKLDFESEGQLRSFRKEFFNDFRRQIDCTIGPDCLSDKSLKVFDKDIHSCVSCKVAIALPYYNSFYSCLQCKRMACDDCRMNKTCPCCDERFHYSRADDFKNIKETLKKFTFKCNICLKGFPSQ